MKKWRGTIIIIVIAIVFMTLPIKATQTLRNLTWIVLRPVGIVFQDSLGRFFPYFNNLFHLNQVVKENHDLVSENLNLQSQLARLSEMQNENEILKKELSFVQSANSINIIPAAIIGRSQNYLKTIVIDKGTNQGLIQGQAVVSQGYLIGTLTSVRQNNSEVTLITDNSSQVPVILQTSRGTGLLQGGLSGLTVQDVPLNIPITNGENVVTSNLGGLIPEGILIGKVNSVMSREGEIFQQVSLSSPIDFSSLEVVMVVK